MRSRIVGRFARCVFVVATAGLVAVALGGGDGAGLGALHAGPVRCSAQPCLGVCGVPCDFGQGTCVGNCWHCSSMLLSVGGVAELPDAAGASAGEAGAPAEGSGWSSASYTALAAGLAAAVALSAGGWYARRWWIR